MESSSFSGKLQFFKIMFGDFKERLRIPDNFLKHLSEKSYGIAIIKGPSGSCWRVQVNTDTSGLYFEDGWDKFSADHSLTLGELLIFSYYGDMKFVVEIFSKSGCKREDANGAYCSQDPSTGQRKEEEGAKKEAYSFTSCFPKFVTELTTKHVSRTNPANLNIPLPFARDHLPDVPTEMTLQNLEGHSWTVTAYICKTNHYLSSGWRIFLRENNLSEGDCCVFELVSTLKFQVHIFRVGDEKYRVSE